MFHKDLILSGLRFRYLIQCEKIFVTLKIGTLCHAFVHVHPILSKAFFHLQEFILACPVLVVVAVGINFWIFWFVSWMNKPISVPL